MLEERIIESKDWATILFVVSFVVIVVAKTFFETRFNEFLKLIVSDKYIKIYKDGSHTISWFNVAMFFVHIVSVSFFTQVSLSAFGLVSKYSGLVFIQITTVVTVFVLSKILIDKIIAASFGVEEFGDQFSSQKINYRNYMAFLLLPVSVFLFYNNFESIVLYYVLFSIILLVLLMIFVKNLKINKNIIFHNLFYFILYLCVLEIAPYYFMYYLFTCS